MNDFRSRMWPAFERAGFLKTASFAVVGCPSPLIVKVRFSKPDAVLASGHISREYTIRYQFDDLPGLAVGDECVIDDMLFRVRNEPIIPDDDSGSGFWRECRLTKQAT